MCKKLKAYPGQLRVPTPIMQQTDTISNNNKIKMKLKSNQVNRKQ